MDRCNNAGLWQEGLVLGRRRSGDGPYMHLCQHWHAAHKVGLLVFDRAEHFHNHARNAGKILQLSQSSLSTTFMPALSTRFLPGGTIHNEALNPEAAMMLAQVTRASAMSKSPCSSTIIDNQASSMFKNSFTRCKAPSPPVAQSLTMLEDDRKTCSKLHHQLQTSKTFCLLSERAQTHKWLNPPLLQRICLGPGLSRGMGPQKPHVHIWRQIRHAARQRCGQILPKDVPQ